MRDLRLLAANLVVQALKFGEHAPGLIDQVVQRRQRRDGLVHAPAVLQHLVLPFRKHLPQVLLAAARGFVHGRVFALDALFNGS